jgi:hypothetical protein
MRQQIIVDALESCLKNIYEQRISRNKTWLGADTNYTFINMAGEKN